MTELPQQKTADEKFCHECGTIIKAKAEICPKCGVRQPSIQQSLHEFTGKPGEKALKAKGKKAKGELLHEFTGKLGEKKCLDCGYQGPMKTWLGNYFFPQLIAFVLLLSYIVPGVIFIAWFWGKHKCPRCGAIGKTVHCSECGRKISDQAASCPGCGAPLDTNQRKSQEKAAPVLGAVSVGLGVASILMPYFAAVFFVPSVIVCGIIAFRMGQKGWGVIAIVLGLIGLLGIFSVSYEISKAQRSLKELEQSFR